MDETGEGWADWLEVAAKRSAPVLASLRCARSGFGYCRGAKAESPSRA
jgi:hypothetical protein